MDSPRKKCGSGAKSWILMPHYGEYAYRRRIRNATLPPPMSHHPAFGLRRGANFNSLAS